MEFSNERFITKKVNMVGKHTANCYRTSQPHSKRKNEEMREAHEMTSPAHAPSKISVNLKLLCLSYRES
jgi:hypothetical protein